MGTETGQAKVWESLKQNLLRILLQNSLYKNQGKLWED